MKKKTVGMLLIGVMLVLAGCGKKEAQPAENSTEVQEDTEVPEETEERESTQSGKALYGVYPDVEEVEDIPMGYFVDGKQEKLCSIPMPLDYIVLARYTPDGDTFETFEEAAGTADLKTALDKGLKEQEYAIYNIRVGLDGTDLEFSIYSVAKGNSMENMKEWAKSYQELRTGQHPAIIYEVEDKYDDADVYLYYTLNEDYMLLIRCESPLADEIGKDQLAQNLYDLVEVIE